MKCIPCLWSTSHIAISSGQSWSGIRIIQGQCALSYNHQFVLLVFICFKFSKFNPSPHFTGQYVKWSLCLWSFLALAVKDGQNVNMDIGLDVMTHGHCNSLASGGMGFRYRVWVTLPRCLGQNLLSLGADLEKYCMACGRFYWVSPDLPSSFLSAFSHPSLPFWLGVIFMVNV